ncbi:helix-turn-helix domain-containing protein [Arthrobacter sp. MYb213]|uniref:helix-turn-helix domain-containing protein n=1 Tax=Arthrobacter sp. MYb213 TaxID=1848595 RepID=UPI000CFBC717|nr:helix-turn-helix domain-containing protein [Arthrobacter sp. MYb213]PRB68049.1 DNA-binding protein [Arthrobacter sp. MYb213]
MKHNEIIAINIRRFRRERGLSLGELAKRTGTSKQTLSRIEAGVGNPTIETLEAICLGLGTSVPAMLSDYGSNIRLQRAAEALVREHRVGFIRDLDRIYGTGFVETSIIRVSVQKETVFKAHARGTLHQTYVISGEVVINGEFDRVQLSAGDSFRFPGDITHGYRANGSEAVLHITTTVPQVAQFRPIID